MRIRELKRGGGCITGLRERGVGGGEGVEQGKGLGKGLEREGQVAVAQCKPSAGGLRCLIGIPAIFRLGERTD